MSETPITAAAGIAAYQTGDVAEARRILAQVVKIELHDEQAWYYLGLTQSDPEKRRHCLQKALLINPDHADARRELDAILDEVHVSHTKTTDTAESPKVININAPPKATKATSGAKSSSGAASSGAAFKVPGGIPGAPQRFGLDEARVLIQTLFNDSVALLTRKTDGAFQTTSWWHVVISVLITGFLLGIVNDLRHIISVIQNNNARLNFEFMLTSPFLTALTALIAVGAGAFLSHWFINQRNGKNDLLAHSDLVVRVWVAGSAVLAILSLLETLLRAPILNIWTIFAGRSVTLQGTSIFLSLAAAGIVVYALYLLVNGFRRLHVLSVDNQRWLTAIIALLLISYIF